MTRFCLVAGLALGVAACGDDKKDTKKDNNNGPNYDYSTANGFCEAYGLTFCERAFNDCAAEFDGITDTYPTQAACEAATEADCADADYTDFTYTATAAEACITDSMAMTCADYAAADPDSCAEALVEVPIEYDFAYTTAEDYCKSLGFVYCERAFDDCADEIGGFYDTQNECITDVIDGCEGTDFTGVTTYDAADGEACVDGLFAQACADYSETAVPECATALPPAAPNAESCTALAAGDQTGSIADTDAVFVWKPLYGNEAYSKVFCLTVVNGDSGTITTSAAGGEAEIGDTVLTLFTGTGEFLAQNDDIDYDNNNWYSSVTYSATASDELIVVVSGYSTSSTGDFTVTVTPDAP